MKEFWNDRYKANDYAYGTEPNAYLKEVLDTGTFTGSALFPAEGEGRNAVYAAKTGLDVYAFDTSVEGKNKALKLAGEEQVNLNYQVGDLLDLELSNRTFDVIVLVYAHFPEEVANRYYPQLIKMLNPGGVVILEGFSKNNLPYREKNPGIGGPADLDLLFSTDEIEDRFKSLKTLSLEEKEVELSEGKYHNGVGMVIRYIGKKE